MPGTSQVILHKSTLPAVQRARRRLQDEDKVTCGLPGPAAHAPNIPREHQELETEGKVSEGGFELCRLQMRSFWMLQNTEQGFPELFDMGKHPPTTVARRFMDLFKTHRSCKTGFPEHRDVSQTPIFRASAEIKVPAPVFQGLTWLNQCG